MPQNTTFDDRRADCEITICGEPAVTSVTHPRRGRMDVCPVHAENIRALDSTRFGGVPAR